MFALIKNANLLVTATISWSVWRRELHFWELQYSAGSTQLKRNGVNVDVQMFLI